MSPAPVRFDPKARKRPSGENNGLDSLAGCETSRRAMPPSAGTDQMSPPETKAISFRSGEKEGSVKSGSAEAKVTKTQTTRARKSIRFIFVWLYAATGSSVFKAS